MPWGSLGSIWAEVGLNYTKFNQGVNDVTRGAEELEQSLTKRFAKLGESFDSVGQNLSLRLTAPLAAVGVVAAKSFSDFESSMANVWTLLDTGKAGLDQFSEGIEKMAETVPQTASQLADGLYQVISASVPAGKAMGVLEVAAKSASAGLTTTFTSVDAITTVLNAYGESADRAGYISDIMFKTVERGKLNFEQLASTMGQVIPQAAQAGVGLEEVAGAYAMMTKQGISAENAATSISYAIRSIVAPTDAAMKIAQSYGIQLNEQALASKGLAGVMEEIAVKTGGSQKAIADMLGSVEAARAATVLGRDAAKEYKDEINAMADAVGSSVKAFDKQAQSTASQTALFKNEIQALSRDIGGELIPILRQGAAAITPLVKGFQSLPPGAKSAIVEFGLFAAAIGPLSIGIGGLITVLSGPAGLALAIGAVVAALVGWSRTSKDVESQISRQVDSSTQHIARLRGSADDFGKQAQQLSDLLSKYENIEKNSRSSASAQRELRDVLQSIGDIAPEAVTQWDKLGMAMEINTSKARDSIVSMLEAKKTLLEASQSQIDHEVQTLDDTVKRAQDRLKEVREDISDAASRERGAKAKSGYAEQYKEMQDSIPLDAAKALKLPTSGTLTKTQATKLQNEIDKRIRALKDRAMEAGVIPDDSYQWTWDQLIDYWTRVEKTAKAAGDRSDKLVPTAEANLTKAQSALKQFRDDTVNYATVIKQIDQQISTLKKGGLLDTDKVLDDAVGGKNGSGSGGANGAGAKTGTTTSADADIFRWGSKIKQLKGGYDTLKAAWAEVERGLMAKDTDVALYEVMKPRAEGMVDMLKRVLVDASNDTGTSAQGMEQAWTKAVDSVQVAVKNGTDFTKSTLSSTRSDITELGRALDEFDARTSLLGTKPPDKITQLTGIRDTVGNTGTDQERSNLDLKIAQARLEMANDEISLAREIARTNIQGAKDTLIAWEQTNLSVVKDNTAALAVTAINDALKDIDASADATAKSVQAAVSSIGKSELQVTLESIDKTKQEYGQYIDDKVGLDLWYNDQVAQAALKAVDDNVKSVDRMSSDEVAAAQRTLVSIKDALGTRLKDHSDLAMALLAIEGDLSERSVALTAEASQAKVALELDAKEEIAKIRGDEEAEFEASLEKKKESLRRAGWEQTKIDEYESATRAKRQRDTDQSVFEARRKLQMVSVADQISYYQEVAESAGDSESQRLTAAVQLYESLSSLSRDATDSELVDIERSLRARLDAYRTSGEGASAMAKAIENALKDIEGGRTRGTSLGSWAGQVAGNAFSDIAGAGQAFGSGASMAPGGSEIWSFIKGIPAAVVEGAKGLFGAIKGAPGAIASAAGNLGGAAMDGIGALSKGAGGLIGIFLQLATSTEQFQVLMKLLNPVFELLVDAVGELVAPLIPIAKEILPILSRVLKALAGVFQWVADVVIGAWNGLAKAINWALGWLGVKINEISSDWRTDVNAEMDGGDDPGTGDPGGGKAGGAQISEITGPTRDLLLETLRPLRALDSMPNFMQSIDSILKEIRDTLRLAHDTATLGAAQYTIQNMTVYAAMSGEDGLAQLLETLRRAANTVKVGSGG